MFELCENLKYLDLSSFIIKNVVNTKDMFFGCENLHYLEKVNYIKLKELNLSDNEISDINILKKLILKN